MHRRIRKLKISCQQTKDFFDNGRYVESCLTGRNSYFFISYRTSPISSHQKLYHNAEVPPQICSDSQIFSNIVRRLSRVWKHVPIKKELNWSDKGTSFRLDPRSKEIWTSLKLSEVYYKECILSDVYFRVSRYSFDDYMWCPTLSFQFTEMYDVKTVVLRNCM